MLKEHNYVFNRLNMALDGAITAASILTAHWLRNALLAPYLLPSIFTHYSRLSDYAWLLLAMPVLMVVFLKYHGYYQSQRISSYGSMLWAITLSAFSMSIATMVIAFALNQRSSTSTIPDFLNGEFVSRGVVIMVPVIASILIALKTVVVRKLLMAVRNRGYNSRSLLLVGSGETLGRFIATVRQHPYWGFTIVGIIDDTNDKLIPSVRLKNLHTLPVLGGLEHLFSYLDANPVDEVVFIPASRSLEELAPYLAACEESGIKTRLSLNFFQHKIAKPILDSFEEIPVLTFNPTKEMNGALLFKYGFDRVIAGLLLVILSPLLVLIALLIKLNSVIRSEPVLYGQERCGLHGKRFTLWKFRSMKMGAEQEKESLEQFNEMSGPVFKMENDPRVTRIGRWLRKLSLDELPQLWNVLKGEMSMVGPRPPLPQEVEKYDRWQRRRLSMKPGITCLWQVNGRNRLSFDTWMKMDLEYIDNWSLALDFRILLKTVYVVLTGYGAM